MKLTVLGSGTCAVTARRSCASYVLNVDDSRILLDIGFGAMRRMAEASLDYRDIDGVICSHLHLDHCGDLGPLLMALQYTPGYIHEKPLHLIGPRNFTAFLQGYRDLHGEWVIPTKGFDLSIHEMHSEQLQAFNGLITARTTRHIQYSNAYRIEFGGKVLFYSGDTGPCDNLVEIAEDADLAIIEASFPDDQPSEYHLTPKQAANLARQANVKRLVLSHFYPMMDQIDLVSVCHSVYQGPIDVAEDLDIFIL